MAANLNFGIENTVDLKVADRRDTTGTGTRIVPIIRNLTFNGSYNFMAEARKLSNISFSGNSQITEKLNLNFNGVFSPYAVQDIPNLTGNAITRVESDRYTFQDGKLPRLIQFGLSFDYSFNPESFRTRNLNNEQFKQEAISKGATVEQAEQLAMIARDPNAFVDFKLPWNFSFNYSLQYSNPLGIDRQLTNTLNFNGDVALTPKWKVQFNSGVDFRRKSLSPTSLSLYRDLHCWDLSFNWVPFGAYQSYSVDLKVKASILQDLRLTNFINSD
ncbi:MAG: hypothetical protein EOO94_03820 [Pedobacter sp.]|nr:MAG: hypothetical protein EOO94_03820 [Pedobacter sp.]